MIKQVYVASDLKEELGQLITNEQILTKKLQQRFDRIIATHTTKIIRAKTRKEKNELNQLMRDAIKKHAERVVKGGIKLGQTWLG
ncbi:MAG: hypothetical protein JKY75_05475 [Erythrobacter sp.]|jgi:DNA-binding transcriptional regulator YbjK|nr:hypothetical protein [Erythrobacter sp.]